MEPQKTSTFTRLLVAGLGLLFVLILAVSIAPPLLFGEPGVDIGLLLLNTLLLAIPAGLLCALLGVLIYAARQVRLGRPLSPRLARAVFWSPRLGGILIVLFMSLFALDAFEAGLPIGQMLLGFLMHMLPMLALAAVIALAWPWPWIGAGFFGIAAVFMFVIAVLRGWQGFSTVLLFALPLAVIALLFAANGRWQGEISLARQPAAPAGG